MNWFKKAVYSVPDYNEIRDELIEKNGYPPSVAEVMIEMQNKLMSDENKTPYNEPILT